MQDLFACKTPILGVLPKRLLKGESLEYLVRVMKITAFILLAFCLQISAKTGAQEKITLKEKNASLSKILTEVRKQTGCSFFLSEETIKYSNPISIDVKNASLREVLDVCFKNQPFTYYINQNAITIIPKKNQNNDSNSSETSLKSLIEVKGRVVDEKEDPVSGATISVQGSIKSTVTNADGIFSLSGVEDAAVLTITHVQYNTLTIKLNGTGFISAKLQVKISPLDEMQVIAYGQTTRRFATGNIATVKAADIEKQSVLNPLLALQGRVPGIEIKQSTGMPGGGVSVRIQGQNSIRSGSDPLIVVDGVPYSSQFTRLWISENIIQGGSPLNFINPSDIESIDVLKDADATAIYGSRAGNGAILITTKKGKVGKTKLSVNLQHGWGKVTRKVDMMNTRQYLDMRYEAYRNDGIDWTSPTVEANDLKLWDTTRYTDWQQALIGGTAEYTNVNASISGGTATMQYLIGGTFNRQTTVFPGSFDDKRGGLHFNVNGSSPNQKFRIQLSASYMHDKNHLPGNDLTNQAIVLAPNAPILYNNDGTLNWELNAAGTSTWDNPLQGIINSDFNNTTKNLVSNINLSYAVLSGLTIGVSSGYTGLHSDVYQPSRLESIAPEYRATTERRASYGTRNMDSWIIEPQVDYKNKIGKSHIEALLGSTIQQSTTDLLFIEGAGYANDLLLKTSLAAKTVTVNQATTVLYRYNGLYGRFNYNLGEKYIVNITGRRDGSSRFGDANKFHNFWGVGVGWIFTGEKWIQNTLPFLSFGKLRGSYGTTGNDGIGDYSYLSLYANLNGQIPYQNAAGLSLFSLPNPYLEWEETRKWQGGIDLGFFNDRIIVNATYAHNRSSNQLASYQLPTITGLTGFNQNLPATIQNTSWEFTLNTTNVKSGQFKWTTSFNLTIPRNKLVKFPNIELTPYNNPVNGVIVGQPLGTLVVYPYGGVDAATGEYLLIDSLGNPTTGSGILQNVFVNTLTKFYGGLQNSITYKGFQLDFLFQFVRQKGPRQLYYYNESLNPGVFYRNVANQPVTVLSRWQKPGDLATASSYTNNVISMFPSLSDAWYTNDASYIRLKNVSLSWQLPANWLSTIHLESGRLYFQGQNLATITKFTGLDPESQSVLSLPPLQMWTVGAQIGF